MKIKFLFLLFFFQLINNVIFAQRETKEGWAVFLKENVNYENKFALFINPLSVLEPQEAAVGIGINCKVARRWDISAELNYLFEGFWKGGDDYTIKSGYRTIFTVKRFSKNGIFFYGTDLRLKYFSFMDKGNFVNAATNDTLFNLVHHANNILLGAAGLAGVRMPLSMNKKWAVELNTGFGIKYRFVSRKNIPSGYDYYHKQPLKMEYNFTSEQDMSGSNIYFPTAIRIIYFF